MKYETLPIIYKITEIKYSPVKEQILKENNINYRIYNDIIYYEMNEKEYMEQIKQEILKYYFLFNESKFVIRVMLDYINNIEDLEELFDLNKLNIKDKEKYKPKNKQVNYDNVKSIDTEDINNISIEDILIKLGIEIYNKGNNIILYENLHYTDGRRGNKEKNIVNDFSMKGRPHGGPFNFVKEYFNFDNNATFQWFKENYF